MSSATTLLCAAALLLCACLAMAQAQQRGYTNKYDNVDLDKILNNQRLVNNYVQCLVDKQPCPPQGQEMKKAIKELLPEVIRTKCAKCSELQKDKGIKVVRKMQKDYPQEWKLLTDKWDPNGTLMREFEQEIAKRESQKKRQG